MIPGTRTKATVPGTATVPGICRSVKKLAKTKMISWQQWHTTIHHDDSKLYKNLKKLIISLTNFFVLCCIIVIAGWGKFLSWLAVTADCFEAQKCVWLLFFEVFHAIVLLNKNIITNSIRNNYFFAILLCFHQQKQIKHMQLIAAFERVVWSKKVSFQWIFLPWFCCAYLLTTSNWKNLSFL